MKLPSHNRYDYVPITERAEYTWPDGKRLAVYFCNNIEYFAFGTGLGSDSAVQGAPQTQRTPGELGAIGTGEHVRHERVVGRRRGSGVLEPTQSEVAALGGHGREVS